MPALKGATLVPYFGYLKTSTLWIQTEYTTWLLIGGVDKDGEVNKTTYVSYGYRVSWSSGDTSLFTPDPVEPSDN